jgi:uncharacterized cupin superfamily protein
MRWKNTFLAFTISVILLLALTQSSNATKTSTDATSNPITIKQSTPAPDKMITYVRLYPDSEGETHFEDVQVKLTASEAEPPDLPFYASSFEKATRYGYYSSSPGWVIDWHPAPQRQFLFFLAGEIVIKASDGEERRFSPGSILLVEDTTGKGHVTRLVGSGDVLTVVVQLD